MIHVTVNNKTHSLQKSIVVKTLLKELGIATNGIAVAVNKEILPKEDWATATLKNNDTVLIIQATQGG